MLTWDDNDTLIKAVAGLVSTFYLCLGAKRLKIAGWGEEDV